MKKTTPNTELEAIEAVLPLSVSSGEIALIISPPPYSPAAAEQPGESITDRQEYLRSQQTRLQEQRARILELQRIEDEEAQIREEIHVLRAREESLR